MHRDGIAHDLRQAEQIRQPDHARLPIANGVSDDDLQVARIAHAERIRKALRPQRGWHPFTASKRARAVRRDADHQVEDRSSGHHPCSEGARLIMLVTIISQKMQALPQAAHPRHPPRSRSCRRTADA